MSRSFVHVPVRPDRDFHQWHKSRANRKLRRKVHMVLQTEEEPEVFPEIREVSQVYDWKDYVSMHWEKECQWETDPNWRRFRVTDGPCWFKHKKWKVLGK